MAAEDERILSVIGGNQEQNVATKELCRLGAIKLSLLRPTMDANGINLVAVGLEQLGAEDFVEGKFFDGEVYIDEGKKTYRDLNYKRFNIINIWAALLSRISRAAVSEAKGRSIVGNLSGDGLQNGGLLIVTKGGMRVLLNKHEQVPGDHVTNEEILSMMNLTQVQSPEDSDRTTLQQDLEAKPPCDEECAVP